MDRVTVNSNQDGFELNGKPFFYLGDTMWSAFTNITLEEWAYYLKYRKAQGFNVLQINTMPQWDRCLGDTGRYPFPMKAEQVFDYTKFNQDYYENAKKMCQMAVEQGFQLALVVLWVNYVPGTWGSKVTDANVMPFEFISRYTNKIIDEFEQFSPIYVVSGDTGFDTEESIAYYREALNVLNEKTPESLKAFHIKRGYDIIPEEFLEGIDFYMFQSGHNKTEQDKAYVLPETFAEKYPKKPMINSEPCYEQMGYSRQLYGRFHEQDTRAAAWTSVLAGAGAGVTYGAHGIWNWQKDNQSENPILGEGFDEAFSWRDAIRFPGAWDYGFIREFLQDKNITCIRPAMELLGNNTKEIRVAQINGNRYLIYLPHSTNVTLKKTFGNLTVRAIDLGARKSSYVEHCEKNGVTIIKMHPFAHDALLILSEDN